MVDEPANMVTEPAKEAVKAAKKWKEARVSHRIAAKVFDKVGGRSRKE